MMLDRFVIAVAQIAPKLGDIAHNLENHIERAEQAIQLGADLIIYPELSLTGYLLKDLTSDVAQNIRNSEIIKKLAKFSEKISLLFGFVEEDENYIYYNSACLLSEGEIKALHRKVYLPTYGMFDEERYFSPGTTFRSFNTCFGKVAILICEDYWHPSSVYLAAQDGAVLHFYVANTPQKGTGLPDKNTLKDIASTATQIYSQAYGIYTVYANRVGYEDGISFGGLSRVINPAGSIIARADRHEEELLLAEIEHGMIRRSRISSPMMGDEKLDLVYRELGRIMARRYNLDDQE